MSVICTFAFEPSRSQNYYRNGPLLRKGDSLKWRVNEAWKPEGGDRKLSQTQTVRAHTATLLQATSLVLHALHAGDISQLKTDPPFGI